MARTKAEVRQYLESTIGQSIDANCGVYRGQCVSFVKGLLNFLGAPNPYAARGHAKDYGDTLLRQCIATNARGWLNVVVNRDMGLVDGVRYGHIWIDLSGEANYEQNGARALCTTKNTRPISQGQQIINLDKWIGEDEVKIGSGDNWRARFNRLHHQLVRNGDMPEAVFQSIVGADAWSVVEQWSDHSESNQLIRWQELGQLADRDKWDKQIYALQDQLRGRPTPEQLAAVQKQLAEMGAKFNEANEIASKKIEENKKLSEKIAIYEKNEVEDKQVADNWLRRLGQFLGKYWK